MKLQFSRQIFEKPSNTKLYENPSVEDELFHADGRSERRTDMTKLIVAFHNFANASKNKKYILNDILLLTLHFFFFASYVQRNLSQQ
jgi:hypothetical protein